MAPKPKGKAKAKAKVAPMRGIPAGGAMARPAARLRPPRVRLRPAAHGDPGKEDVREVWKRGDIVLSKDVDPRDLTGGEGIVGVECHYYHRECKVAGLVEKLILAGDGNYVALKMQGNNDVGLLQLLSGRPDMSFRLHLCEAGCNFEESADDLIHMVKLRKLKGKDHEEGWAYNMEKVAPAAVEDDLAALRARQTAMGGAPLGGTGGEAPEEKDGDAEEAKGKKDKKKKKKKKKEKDADDKGKSKKEKKSKEDEKKKKKESTESTSSEEDKMTGYHSKSASVKPSQDLFRGTGLDSREKVRNRVAKRARKHLKRKSEKLEDSGLGPVEEGIFAEASKTRSVAENFPGALCNQALNSMRAALINEVGMEDYPNRLHPCAVAYFRQHLARRTQGPAQRELLTLSTCIDLLLKGRAAAAADVATQRVKSIEQTMGGAHWAVAQKLEILAPEQPSLTPPPEASSAQKEMALENKVKWQTSQPDPKSNRGNQTGGGGKGRGDQKGKGQGKDKNGKTKGGKDPKEGDKKKDWGLAEKRRDWATTKKVSRGQLPLRR